MKTSWTNGLTPELQAEIKANFIEALLMRKRLVEMLEGKISGSQGISRSKGMYDTPNWAYLQADQNGYERALSEIIDLLVDKK